MVTSIQFVLKRKDKKNLGKSLARLTVKLGFKFRIENCIVSRVVCVCTELEAILQGELFTSKS